MTYMVKILAGVRLVLSIKICPMRQSTPPHRKVRMNCASSSIETSYFCVEMATA